LRHTVLALLAATALLLAWRIRALENAGRALHDKEVAARALAERILRAQEERRRNPPAGARIAPYEYLSALLEERRVGGLTPLPDRDRELFAAGGYVFHVRLLNKLQRPLSRRPDDPGSEPGLGNDFELWAWPADPADSVLALFFGSDAGFLLQGDNGVHAGPEARPESVLDNPARKVEAQDGKTQEWIVVANFRDS
jgi:hypothetical protein